MDSLLAAYWWSVLEHCVYLENGAPIEHLPGEPPLHEMHAMRNKPFQAWESECFGRLLDSKRSFP